MLPHEAECLTEIPNWEIQAQRGLAFESSQTFFFFTEIINITVITIHTLPNAFIVNLVKNP